MHSDYYYYFTKFLTKHVQSHSVAKIEIKGAFKQSPQKLFNELSKSSNQDLKCC